MAKTETITRPNPYYGNVIWKYLNIASKSTESYDLPSAYTVSTITVARAAGSGCSGIYQVDTWGGIVSIVPATGITITKQSDSATVTISNDNTFAVNAIFAYRV